MSTKNIVTMEMLAEEEKYYLFKKDAEAIYAEKGGTYEGMTVGKANRLTNTRKIDGVSFNGTTDISRYGTCQSQKTATAKTVTITGFAPTSNGKPEIGAKVVVKFPYANEVENPTLNVNGTGAIRIKADGDTIYVKWLAGAVMEFIYDGMNWVVLSGYALAGMRVGKYYTSDDRTSPGKLYGGSWEQIKGRFIYGTEHDADLSESPSSLAEYMGGSNEHKLTIDEIPPHRHEIIGFNGSTGSDNRLQRGSKGAGDASIYYEDIGLTGGGKSFDIRPKYQEAYKWRRTA